VLGRCAANNQVPPVTSLDAVAEHGGPARRTGLITDTSSAVPLYYQVLSVIRQRIANGSYEANGKLPSEDELAGEFGVSRATIRQAVGELVRLGFVIRQQGRGTFVLPAASHAMGQRFQGSLRDLISETERTLVTTVELVRDAPFPARIAAALEIEDLRGTVVRRRRTMDGEVFAFTVNYLPPRVAALVTDDELHKTGLMTLLERKGVTFAGGYQSIRAELADLEVSHWLEVGFGAAVLFVERVLVDSDGGPCEFVQSHYRGDRYEFTVNLGHADSGDADLRRQLA